ncbi:MAG TPA: hypothetical protein VM733_05675 [Thermoanaerobaculia bacterium]|nr:hypothetical protein [Thermoanaerobaculia bacterium]
MEEITRDVATDRFLQFLIDRARNGTIEGIHEILSEGPAGRKPAAVAVARHEWFRGLSAEDQSRVVEIIHESVDSAIFGVLVVLDGLAGGNPVEGVTSDFSIALQTYVDEHARRDDAAKISVRINPSDTTESLHDRFRWKLDAMSQG